MEITARGLDDTIQPYVDNFVNGEITGHKLLILDHQDLDRLGVLKLGHQELFLEAIDLLCQLQYTLENETVQSMALKLNCQSKCVNNDIEHYERTTSKQEYDRLPVGVLTGIIKVVGHTKTLVSWLDRAPFDGSSEYIKKRNLLVKLASDLITAVQGDSVFENTEDVKTNCQTIADICDNLIQNSKDTLTIQPAWLEMALIRKKPEEELGMHIQSSYSGTHTIGGVKDESPAHRCKKIEEGDEVIMVNGQMVIGWQMKKLVNTLKENKKEINLTLKKRPCHADPFGHKGHRKKRGSKLKPGTFPNAAYIRGSKKKSRLPLALINTTPDQTTETFSESVKEVESENDALDDNDNVFRSGSESPGFQNLRTFDDKVKHRRATVSGGSPTLKRPSIMISDSDCAPRPKSYALALSSPGSEDFSSFELSSFDLGSPASEKTTDSDTGSKVLSPPPSFGKIGAMKARSFSGNHSNNNSPLKGVFTPPISTARHNISVSGDSSILQKGKMDKDSNSNSSVPEVTDKISAKTLDDQSKIKPSPNLNQQPNTNKSISVHSPMQNPVNQKSSPINNQTVTNTPGVSENSITSSVNNPGALVSQTSSTPLNSNSDNSFRGSNINARGISGSMVSNRDTRTPSPAKSISSSSDSGGSYSGSNTGAYPKMKRNITGSDSPKMFTQLPYDSSPWKKSSEQAAKVIAGAVEELKSPTLISIKRIDSKYRADLAEQERRQRELSSPESSSGRDTPQDEDRPVSTVASYSVNIVGGVPQIVKSPPGSMAHDKDFPSPAPSPSILRVKEDRGGTRNFRQRLKATRRVSCKDLGQGDCQGWLYKKKDSHGIGSKFVKRWVILKNSNLYYYKSQDDQRAEGVIHLPGFQVSPAREVHTKKYAFKAHHSGTTFYFASDRQEDMAKWMNKMGLSAIVYDTSALTTTAGFVKPDDKNLSAVIENPAAAGYYSESDEEDPGSTPSTPQTMSRKSSMEDLISLSSSRDDLIGFAKSLTRDNVKLDGQDVEAARKRRLTKDVEMLDISNPQELEKLKRLNSLERTLKVKENELTAIELLLDQTSIDSDIMQSFKQDHPEVLNSLQEEVAGNQSVTSATSEDE